MPVNQYFNHFNYSREQNLYESLIIEAIKIYGHSVYYIPRTLVNEDEIFGEDILNTFNDAVEVEVYIKNVEGYEGEGDLISKFGLDIRDQITFTIAKKRFDQIRNEKIMGEVGFNILLETSDTDSPGTESSFELMSENSDDYQINSSRPMEGDLIYFPMVEKTFEIRFVEHEALFYQTGKLNTYDLKCELFEYSHERFETGNTTIDSVETLFSGNLDNFEFTLEDETGVLANEVGESIILEEYRVETFDTFANNEIIQSESISIVDFTEANPFGERTY